MELYIQFGHGMMTMSEELLSNWQAGVVILSPRDLKYEQMERFSAKVHDQNSSIVIDPQFYVPTSEHTKLTGHSFWPDDYQTAWLNRASISQMLTRLKDEYNDSMQSLFFILPSIRSSEINQDWVSINEMVVNEAIRLNPHENLYATLCFSHEIMRSEEQIHLALEYIETWDIQGCYIVAEPPNNSYLIDDPIWLINLLDLVAGIKQQGKRVVVGYSSHQMLCLALGKADAIATGNFLNVRSFNTARFNAPEDGAGRRSTWYYSPQALSEYQIPFLDIAHRMGILDELRTPINFNSPYVDALFSGAQPTSTGYEEGDSFRHYLQCLKSQTEQSVKPTYAATRESLKLQLETAREITEFMQTNGIRGRNRDFANVVDVNISAIDAFDRLRGMIQEHKWNNLLTQ